MRAHQDYEYEEDFGPEEDYEIAAAQNNVIVGDAIDPESHLQAKDLYGVQTKIFNMSINGSLEQLGADQNKATWKMDPAMQNLLRQVVTPHNRTNATDENLAGDIGKTVILHAKILQERNDFPVTIGLNIPALVPQVYDKSRRYNWILERNTPTTVINQDIFEPDNVFTKYMYEKLQKLDVESLGQQVRFDVDPTGRHALVDPNGFVWQVMMNNVYQGNFGEAGNSLMQIDAELRDAPYTFGARVPADIAREVVDAIKEPLQKIEQSFVDMRTLQASFERVDGQAWNSFNNLIGEAAGMDADSKGYLKEHALNTQYNASVKLLIQYIVY
jgi:hypothetical protein